MATNGMLVFHLKARNMLPFEPELFFLQIEQNKLKMVSNKKPLYFIIPYIIVL
ncbi:hypothetical protein MettiDRAFT_1541 [Methanolobus tindarius DSM 2278]|jgi:hypothetical protein|uniref:Uncharacterized protein n=1 Tax=Methanolobus tindarius DSM 2278 TaxID=1090322 RepID=W9DXH1_METTI|nr:hypothetical protein MettiDRAFT_1541 [Methanolobus tindarius DSM 2278]